MDLKVLVILVYNALFFGYTFGQNDGGCQIEGISESSWSLFSLQAKDNQIDEEIFSGTYTGSLSVVSYEHASGTSGPDVSEFFTVTSNDTYFSIATTQRMEDFDKEMDKTPNSIRSQLTVKLECDEGVSTLVLVLEIVDVNDYDPEFLEESYVFEVASPLMPPMDFSVYGSAVMVIDWDFSNQDVTFAIEPDDFSIATETTSTSKNYTAIFSARNIIQLTEATVYTLTATDSGNPSRSSSVEVTLTPSASLSLDKPTFSSSSYSFNYTVVEDQPVLTPLGDRITLRSNRLSESPKLTITGESADSFNTPTVDETTGVIDLTLNKALTSSSSIIALTLTVETDNPAVTNILINLPQVSLLFAKHIYTGTYDADTKEVSLDDEEIVIEAVGLSGDPTVEFSEDFAENFELTPEGDNTYRVGVKAELTGDELRQLPLGVKMTATIDGEADEAYLLLYSTVERFRFLQPRYSAYYSPDDDTVVLDSPIQFTDELGEVTATVEDDSLSGYLNLTCDTSEETCAIDGKMALPQTILDAQTELTLAIKAQDGYGNSAETVLTVSIPQGPKFDGSLYTATYPDSGEGSFDFDGELKFQNEDDATAITVDLDSYGDNLQVFYEDKWRVRILKPLNVTEKSLVITMSARKSGAVNAGKSVLVLKLPDETRETLVFSDPYYRVQYNETTDVMYFQPSIAFENTDVDSVSVSISGDYDDNFSAEKEENGWQLVVKSALEHSVIRANNELVMAIVAEDQNGNNGTTVLVVDLPTLPEPKFSRIYYTGTYQDGEVSLDDTIVVDSVDEIVDVAVEDRFSDNFSLEPNGSHMYNLTVLNQLENLTDDEVTIGLTATDSVGSASSTLVLTVVKKVAPKFSQMHYVATYDNETGAISYDQPITITNRDEASSVDVALEEDEYSTNFGLVRDGDAWKLEILSRPESDDSLFVFTLKATADDNEKYGEAVLVVRFLSASPKDPPAFSRTYYTGQYLRATDGDTVTLDYDIELTTQDPDDVQVVSDNFDGNFKVNFDAASSTCTIEVTQNVNEDTITASKELIVSLNAIDQYGSASATLVLQLPQYEVPEFSQPSYKITYINETDLRVDFPINITNKELSTVTIVLEESNYETNFKLTPNPSTSSWDFEVDSLPEAAEYPLVLTLKATETSSDAHGEATLIFNVLSEENNQAPIFSRPHYFAVYRGGDNVTSEPIEVTNKDASTLRLELDSYDPNFSFVLDDSTQQWSIQVATPLPDDILGNNSELVLTITAREEGNVNVGEATLIVYLPSTDVDALAFDEVYYDAEYDTTVEKPVVTLAETITVSSNSALNLLMEMEPQDYFSLQPTDSGYTVHVDQEIPEDVLRDQKSLVYVITATSDDREARATLVVHLPATSTVDLIKFSNVLYSATYKEEDGNATFTVNDDILIETDLGDEEYTVDIEEDSAYKSYFTVSHSDKKVIVGLTDDELPNLNVNFIPLALIAKATDTSDQSSAVLNVEIARDDSSDEEFSIEKPLYSGEYIVENATLIVDSIQIVSERSMEDINVSIDNENFDYDETEDKVITLKLKDGNSLPEDVTNDAFLSLIVTASIVDTTLSATTVFNIKIVQTDVASAKLNFPNVISNGEYEVVDNEAVLTLEGIPLETDQSKEDIDLTIDDAYSTYFTADYEDGKVTISTNEVIPPPNLAGLTSIVFTLTASTTDGAVSSKTVINLKIIGSSSDDEVISMEKPLYNGEYIVENATLIVDPIQIVSERNMEDINVSINNENFDYDETDDKVITLKLKDGTPLPEDVTNDAFLSLIVTASIVDTTLSATTVFNIKIVQTDVASTKLNFPNVITNGEYEVVDNEAVLTLEGIPLETDQSKEDIDLKIDDDYNTYFTADYEDGKVTISTNEVIPAANLAGLTSIVFTLTASTTDGAVSSETVINLKVIGNNSDNEVISIEKPLYSGEYSEIDSTLKVEDIQIVTDSTDTIEINIDNDDENAEYFTYTVTAEKILRLSLSESSLPSALVESYSFVPLVITASVGASSARTIVNIRIIKSDGNSTVAYVNFPTIINTGTYRVTDEAVELELEAIPLSTDQEDGNVDVRIADGDFADNFNLGYADHLVTVTPSAPIPTESLSALTSVLLTIEASVKDTSYKAQTVVSLEVIHDVQNVSTISFDKILHTAEYKISDGKGKFEIEDAITVQTSEENGDISTSITDDGNGFSRYFKSSYSDNQFTVTLPDGLPDEALKYSFIALTLTAVVAGDSRERTYASAVLNVKIEGDGSNGNDDDDSNSFNKTPWIVAIAVMAALLALLLAAAIAFYFLKLRRKDYTDVDEDLWKVRFAGIEKKKKHGRGPTPVETRRPTAFEFNQLEEDEADASETSTDPERRKSVIFDDNVEKMEIDKVDEEEDPGEKRSGGEIKKA